jgi:hypothetical protein
VSGTALDHRLVRGYLSGLDAAMRGLPAAQARELREQIIAHLDDALGPGASDQEVAATLSRLGSPADLAAEAAPRWARCGSATRRAATRRPAGISTSPGSTPRWSCSPGTWKTSVTCPAPTRPAGRPGRYCRPCPGPARATDAAAGTVRADAVGVGAGYPPAVVHAVAGLLAGITDLRNIRVGVTSSAMPASLLIKVYTAGVIDPADTFSAAVGDAAGDTRLQATAASLAALLRTENDQSVQRAILFAALTGVPPVLRPEELSELQQAATDARSDLSAFNSSASPAEQKLFGNTVSGAAVDRATALEILAEQSAATRPSAPLTGQAGLDAGTWYPEMTTTIDDTRVVTGHLVGQLSGQADALKSDAIRNLLLTSTVTLLLLLVLLTSAVLGRPLRR